MNLTPEQRQKEKEFIDNPMGWPMLVLPVKRYNGSGAPELGRMHTGMAWRSAERTVYLATIYEKVTDETERVVYENTDALLDAGWIVD